MAVDSGVGMRATHDRTPNDASGSTRRERRTDPDPRVPVRARADDEAGAGVQHLRAERIERAESTTFPAVGTSTGSTGAGGGRRTEDPPPIGGGTSVADAIKEMTGGTGLGGGTGFGGGTGTTKDTAPIKVTTPALDPTEPPRHDRPRIDAPIATFRTAVVIYENTDLEVQAADGSMIRVTASMSDAERQHVLDAGAQFRDAVNDLSAGQASLGNVDVILLPQPVRHVTNVSSTPGDPDYMLGTEDVRADLTAAGIPGTYDSVIVLWKSADDAGNRVPMQAGGWGGYDPAMDASYATIQIPEGGKGWGPNGHETIVHEWLHGVEQFAANAGHPVPDLHDVGAFGYEQWNGSWSRWYRDLMQGTLPDGQGGTTGITPDAWRAIATHRGLGPDSTDTTPAAGDGAGGGY